MKDIKFILLFISVAPFYAAGQTDLSFIKHKAFIKSLEYCNVSEFQDTACRRLKRGIDNYKYMDGRMFDIQETIMLDGQHQMLSIHSDSSIDRLFEKIQGSADSLCKKVKGEQVVAVVYQSYGFGNRHGRRTEFQSFNTHEIFLPGLEFSLSGDTLSVLIFSGYHFTIHEMNASTKEVVKTFTSLNFKDNEYIKLRYKTGFTYNFQLTAKFDVTHFRMADLIAISYR